MVKRNPDNYSLQSKSLLLEQKDKEAIRGAVSDTPVDINEMKIDRYGLNIQPGSTDIGALREDELIQSLKESAHQVGYNSSRMTGRKYPLKERWDDDCNKWYYTIDLWFKHMR